MRQYNCIINLPEFKKAKALLLNEVLEITTYADVRVLYVKNIIKMFIFQLRGHVDRILSVNATNDETKYFDELNDLLQRGDVMDVETAVFEKTTLKTPEIVDVSLDQLRFEIKQSVTVLDTDQYDNRELLIRLRDKTKLYLHLEVIMQFGATICLYYN